MGGDPVQHAYFLSRECCSRSTKSQHAREAAFESLIAMTSSPHREVKKLVGMAIPTCFMDFPHLQEKAVDAVYDICEDGEAEVRMAGYRTFEAISRVALSWVKRNTDVLIQLLQIESPKEIALIRMLLVKHIDISPTSALEVMMDVLQDPQSSVQQKETLLNILLIEGKSWRKGMGEGRESREGQLLRDGLSSVLASPSCSPSLVLPIITLLIPLPLPLPQSPTYSSLIAQKRQLITRILLFTPPTNENYSPAYHQKSFADPRAFVRFWFEGAFEPLTTDGPEREMLGWLEAWLEEEKTGKRDGKGKGREAARSGELDEGTEGRERWRDVERALVSKIAGKAGKSLGVITRMLGDRAASQRTRNYVSVVSAEFRRLEPLLFSLLVLVQLPTMNRSSPTFCQDFRQAASAGLPYSSTQEIRTQHYVSSALLRYFSNPALYSSTLPPRPFPNVLPSWIDPNPRILIPSLSSQEEPVIQIIPLPPSSSLNNRSSLPSHPSSLPLKPVHQSSTVQTSYPVTSLDKDVEMKLALRKRKFEEQPTGSAPLPSFKRTVSGPFASQQELSKQLHNSSNERPQPLSSSLASSSLLSRLQVPPGGSRLPSNNNSPTGPDSCFTFTSSSPLPLTQRFSPILLSSSSPPPIVSTSRPVPPPSRPRRTSPPSPPPPLLPISPPSPPLPQPTSFITSSSLRPAFTIAPVPIHEQVRSLAIRGISIKGRAAQRKALDPDGLVNTPKLEESKPPVPGGKLMGMMKRLEQPEGDIAMGGGQEGEGVGNGNGHVPACANGIVGGRRGGRGERGGRASPTVLHTSQEVAGPSGHQQQPFNGGQGGFRGRGRGWGNGYRGF